MKIGVPPDQAGLRLDVFLTRVLNGPTRTRLQKFIRSGLVRVNGHATRSAIKVAPGMTIELDPPPPPPPPDLPAEPRPLTILHEDDDILVLNKPAGILVHPVGGRRTGTLVNALLYHCKGLATVGDTLRPGIVHRLDSQTSGVMVVAKNEEALLAIARQFKNRTVRKEYIALTCGAPHPLQGTIQTLIGRHPHHRTKMVAFREEEIPPDGNGRIAISSYRVLEILGPYSLVRIFPQTGRTHQIRVHLAHRGCPIVGDREYGGRRGRTARQSLEALGLMVERQLLHSERLELVHPRTGQSMTFVASLPSDMRHVIETVRAQFRFPRGEGND